MEIGYGILTAIISYLIGGISFSRIVTRIVAPKLDIENIRFPTKDGSEGERLRAVGATTASIQLGPKVGCTIGILDILKAFVPVLTLKLLTPGYFYFLIAAVFLVVGHNWSVYFRFKGGGGISPTYGGFFVVDFIGSIVSSLAGMFFGFFIVRDILIAYTSGLWFMLIWLIVVKGEWPYIIYGLVINLVFILAVLPDLKDQLRKRREGKSDMRAGLEGFPMGRGMLKIMEFFGVAPHKKED